MNEIEKLNNLPSTGNITTDIRSILQEARQMVVRHTNTAMTAAYWLIGRRIVVEEQQNAERADYGTYLLKNLSKELTAEFGNGFSYANLYNMRQFYTTYCNDEIFYTLCRELPWSHNRLIMRVQDACAREWYLREAAREQWSVRQLERNSPYKAIVAFTDKVIDGKVVTEAELNGFPSAEIEQRIEQEPYRFLIVADKFQTGYDQPLLHTMYVDKQISDLKAVQTLSRLNRCHPKKQDTFVLDFANDPEMIRMSFQRYYKTTILAGESDINKLNDLTEIIEGFNFYTQQDVDAVAELKLMGTDADRPKIDAIIDADVKRFKEELNEDEQIKCKSAIKNFCRCYPYFSSIMPFESPEWEKQYIFYALLVKKLPKLKIDDNTQGLLEDIDFDKYRIVKEEERAIVLENEDTAVDPIPVGTGGGKPSPEMDVLSSIVKDFNDTYGNIEWKNRDEVQRQIEELPSRIASSVDFVNAVRNGDRQVAQITFNDDIINIVAGMLEEKTEFVQTYFANPDFQNFVNARVFQAAVSQLSGQ